MKSKLLVISLPVVAIVGGLGQAQMPTPDLAACFTKDTEQDIRACGQNFAARSSP